MRTLLGLCFLRRGQRAASLWDSIVVASNGAAALECLTVHAPDLVVTDLNMPVMDVLELLRRLRANGHHDLPAIVLTARSDQRAAAAAAGADAFLVKPVPLRELAEVAELLIEGRRAPHAAR